MTTPTTPPPAQKLGCAGFCVVGFFILLVIGMAMPSSKPSSTYGNSGKPKLGTQECLDRMLSKAREYDPNLPPSQWDEAGRAMDNECDTESVVTTTKYSYTTTTWSYRR